MSFAAATRRFALQAAAARAEVFGGTAENDTADAAGFNLQFGTVKFRAPFTTLKNAAPLELHGARPSVHAIALVPQSLGLALAIDADLTHLPDGAVFKIVQIVNHPISTDTKVVLRRTES